MSRIGKQPVAVPTGVKVSADAKARTVNVEGPKGKLSFSYRPEVSVELDEFAKVVRCSIPEGKMEHGPTRAYWGTTRARIENMMEGVTKGFTEKLEVVGVGWNAKLQGQTLVVSVGYCNPINLSVPQGVTVSVENNTNITVTGPDKQKVGQFAAELRSARKPEPYKGKGIRYQGEYVKIKPGKAATK